MLFCERLCYTLTHHLGQKNAKTESFSRLQHHDQNISHAYTALASVHPGEDFVLVARHEGHSLVHFIRRTGWATICNLLINSFHYLCISSYGSDLMVNIMTNLVVTDCPLCIFMYTTRTCWILKNSSVFLLRNTNLTTSFNTIYNI